MKQEWLRAGTSYHLTALKAVGGATFPRLLKIACHDCGKELREVEFKDREAYAAEIFDLWPSIERFSYNPPDKVAFGFEPCEECLILRGLAGEKRL